MTETKRLLILDMTIRVEAVFGADLEERGDKDQILSLLTNEKHRDDFIQEMVHGGHFWTEKVDVSTRPEVVQDKLDPEAVRKTIDEVGGFADPKDGYPPRN